VHRAQGAGQRKLCQEGRSREAIFIDAAKRGESRNGNGEIEAASGFSQVRRCKVNDDMERREVHAHLLERRAHSDATLSDRGFRQTHDVEAGGAAT
jgi:hypothetical protein